MARSHAPLLTRLCHTCQGHEHVRVVIYSSTIIHCTTSLQLCGEYANIASHLKIANIYGRMLGGIPVSAVAGSFRSGRQRAHLASGALRRSEYAFLLGRFVDSATLARAEAIAARWGVHPHEVLIANGLLDASDYYRALAESCGAPFKAHLPAAACRRGKPAPELCRRAAEGTRPRKELRLGA